MKIISLMLMILVLSGCESIKDLANKTDKQLNTSDKLIGNEKESQDTECQTDSSKNSQESNERDLSEELNDTIAKGYYASGEHTISSSGTHTIYYKLDDFMGSANLIVGDEITPLITEPLHCYEAGELYLETKCMTTTTLEEGDVIRVTSDVFVVSEHATLEGTYEGLLNERVAYRAGETIKAGAYYVLDKAAYENQQTSSIVYTSMGDWIIHRYGTGNYSDYTFEKIFPNERFYLHEDMYVVLDGPMQLIYLGEFNY